MNSVSPEALEVRVAKLEKSLQWARFGMFGLLLMLIAMFIVWYGVGGIVQREIRVHRIYAVDDAGKVRVRIGQDQLDGKRMSRADGVVIYDPRGLERGGMATMDNGQVAIGLDAPSSAPGAARDRVGMMVDGKGRTMFMLLDARGVPVVMAKGGDKGGNLQVAGMAPDGKHLQVRTLGVSGDTQSMQGGG